MLSMPLTHEQRKERLDEWFQATVVEDALLGADPRHFIAAWVKRGASDPETCGNCDEHMADGNADLCPACSEALDEWLVENGYL